GLSHTGQWGADLVMISSDFVMMVKTGNFSRRRPYQALGQEGVAAVTPLYLSLAPWKNPQTLSERNIMVIGFEPQAQPFKMPEAVSNQSKIQVPDVVLFDQRPSSPSLTPNSYSRRLRCEKGFPSVI